MRQVILNVAQQALHVHLGQWDWEPLLRLLRVHMLLRVDVHLLLLLLLRLRPIMRLSGLLLSFIHDLLGCLYELLWKHDVLRHKRLLLLPFLLLQVVEEDFAEVSLTSLLQRHHEEVLIIHHEFLQLLLI